MFSNESRWSLFIIIFLVLTGLNSLSQAQWPRFHGNSLNTGVIPGAQGRGDTYIEMWTFPILSWTNSSPALADIDGDGLLEVVVAARQEALYALNGEDGSILWSYPLEETNNSASPVINDLDGDGKPEVVFATTDTMIVLEGETGTLIWSAPINGYTGRSPSTGDLDGDGSPEVIYSGGGSTIAYDGETGSHLWAVEGYWVSEYSSPVVEDTDLDGSAEVMVYSLSETNFCLLDGTDGSLIWETPVTAVFWDATPAPAFADLDMDGNPEIVSCAGDNDLYVMNAADGSIKWSTILPGVMYSSPVLLDLDGNDSLEIVVGLYEEEELRAYTCTGELIWTASVLYWPLGTPAVADIDGDQTLEIIQTSVWANGAVQVFDAETGAQEWIKTYTAAVGSSPAIGDLDGDGFFDFVYGCHDGYIYAMTSEPQGIEPELNISPLSCSVSPNPFSSTVSISVDLPERGYASIKVFDLSGKLICSLAESELGSGQQTYVWDGNNQNGESISSGLYICRIQFGGISETMSLCLLR